MNIGWLKFWIALGVVVSIASAALPPFAVYHASADVKRYRECLQGIRLDCDRTMVWNLVDAALLLEQQNGAGSGDVFGLDILGVRTSGALRTSENAPFIEKIEPVGMTNANGTYRANSGAEISLRVTVKGLATIAELYKIEGIDGQPTKVAPFKKGADGVWTVEYKLPPGFNGSLEVRVTGDNPKDLAALAIPVAAN